MYILHEYIIIANAMYIKDTDFITYNDLYEFKKELCNNISDEYKYIMFESPENHYIEAANNRFFKEENGIRSLKKITKDQVDKLNSKYPEEFSKMLDKTTSLYLENDIKNKKGFDEMVEEIEQVNRDTEMIKTNTDYIDWLIDFLKQEEVLTNSDLLYSSDRIKKEDKPNCDKLPLFIDVIKKYAENNNISSIESEEGIFYYVNFKDSTLEIFIGPMYYHVKYEKRNIEEVSINYEDIIKNSIKQKRKGLMYH